MTQQAYPDVQRTDQTAAEKLQAAEGSGGSPLAVMPAPARSTALWLIVVLLAVIATAMIFRADDAAIMRSALAQNVPGAGQPVGARGIYAFTGQIGRTNYGLFMLDVDTGTVWCYEMVRGSLGDTQMKLIAARSWIWDRYLEEFNVADPTPERIRQMVQERQAAGNAPLTP